MDETFDPDVSIEPEQVKLFAQRSDAKGVQQLGLHLFALLITGSLVTWSLDTMFILPAWVLHGIVLTFLFAALHECIHQTAFRSRHLNNLVSGVCGFFLILPPKYFRAFHFAHHRYTQDPSRDPELIKEKPATVSAYLLYISGLPYWYERVTTIFKYAAGKVNESFIPKVYRHKIVQEAQLFLGLYVLLAIVSMALLSWVAVIYWIIPVLLGQPFLRMYLLAEHTGCPSESNMFVNTRTTTTNSVMRLLAWNMPYHVEHHVYPNVPFHALPAIHDILRAKITQLAPGYMQVQRQILNALRK